MASTVLPSAPTMENAGGLRVREFGRDNTFISTNTIEYKFDINNEHSFTFLAGHEGIDNSGQGFFAQGRGTTDDRLLFLNFINPADFQGGDIGEGFSEYAYLSFFGRINYNYKEKYSLDLTMRNDASSRFGKNFRNAQFYAAGFLWNASKENFLADNRTISDLIFRVTYGTQGNSAIGNYDHLALVGTGAYYDGMNGWGLGSPGNPNLTWENQANFNAGFEIGLWKKLNLNVSYYHRHTYDLLYNIPVSLTTGFGSNLMNIAAMNNDGIDIDLNWSIFRNNDWTIDMSAVFGYNANKIVGLYGDVEELLFGTTAMMIGKPYGMFYVPHMLGVDPRDGMPIYNDGNGNSTKNKDKAAPMLTDKHMIAPINGGFNFNAQWKGLVLSAQFSYTIGKWVAFLEKSYLESSAFKGYNRQTNMREIWRYPGDVTDIARYDAPFIDLRDDYLYNASFLRLKNLTVSYSFPKNLLQKTGFIEGARIYFIGRNLLTFTTYPGYDPETYKSITYGEYPMTRQYSFGVELTF